MEKERELQGLFFDEDPTEDFAECHVCGQDRPVFDHEGVDENGAYIRPICQECLEEADDTY